MRKELDDLPNERRCDIKWYEWLYQVSDMGRIKRYSRQQIANNQYWTFIKTYKELILKWSVYITWWYKYKKNHFQCDWNIAYDAIHTIVARAFIYNPNNYRFIIHKDGNTLNNIYSNLEWCEQWYFNRITSIKRKKSVIQITKDWKIVKVWESAKEVMKKLWYDSCSINKCCLNKNWYLTAWWYKREYKK